MFEDVTDQRRSFAYEFITGFMAQCIIDLLKTVDVADNDRKFRFLFSLDLRIEFIFLHQVCVLTLDTCHRIDHSDHLALFGPLIHI